jgi:hypothetical protein
MQFSPLTVSSLIIGPLRYFFSTYGSSNKLVWNDDPKIRTIEIDEYNNLHQITFDGRPRILVDRGGYRMDKTGISDNMAQAQAFSQTQGLEDRINFILYSGTAQITIEARQQGVCELITDMVTHFIAWSRPLICDTQKFKEFGMPMQVGTCDLLPNQEEDEKFQVVIQLPYIKEEQWHVKNDGIILKAVNTTVIPGPVIVTTP